MPPKLSVCVDGFNIAMPKGSGIATYGRNLLDGLAAIGAQTQVLYGPPTRLGKNALLNEVALSDANYPPPPGRLVRERASLASLFGRRAVRVPSSGLVSPSPSLRRVSPDVVWAAHDVFHTANRAFATYGRFTPLTFADAAALPGVMHWTAPLPLALKGTPNLYTIHDVVPLRLPFTTLDHKRRFFNLCRRISRTADHIVTVSDSARADIIQMFGVPEDRITNTYQSVGLPPALTDKTDEAVALENESAFGLGWKGYFLFFGAVEPKKNLARIVEAYLASGVAEPLVIVGADGWLNEPETQLLYPDIVAVQKTKGDRIVRDDRIRRYDFLPFATLVSLIRGAKATLFPSLYEGFGLPVLESMLLGTPVLASTAGSLPEVAGDAALMVDPYDVQAMTRAIRDLGADEGLRGDLSARGRVQAAKFSPAAYQDRLAALYQRIA